jgi:hypothetical protein
MLHVENPDHSGLTTGVRIAVCPVTRLTTAVEFVLSSLVTPTVPDGLVCQRAATPLASKLLCGT